MLRKRFPAFLLVPALSALASGFFVTAFLFALVRRMEPGERSTAWMVLIAGALLSGAAAASVHMLARRLQRHIGEQGEARQRMDERRKGDPATHEHAAAPAFHSSHDGLTGLVNPDLLRDRIRQAMAYADRHQCPVWIAFLDIDRFKLVNDILSHQAGDQALKSVAQRLMSAVRAADTVARLGGDEFVFVLPECHEEGLAETMPQRLMDAVARPVTIDGQEFLLSSSVGIAVYPGNGADPDTLIKHAGIAMYRAKELGRNRFQFYSPAMNQRTVERARIASDLRRALEREEFTLHYQPQIDLHDGRVVGMEALVRWQHPDLGLLAPERFIGLAEDMDLIAPLGAWVLRTACRQNKVWQEAGAEHMRVAVNLSARQFYECDLAASVATVLEQTGLAPQDLELELTESMMMEDAERAIAILNDLKKIGVYLSIDDFGTGYSSLSYLKRFPIDILKIDQSFVHDITTDPDDAMIVASIVSLARSLRLEVVAEGVETVAQLAFLQRQGCDRVQGFHFSRPLSGDACADLLRESRRLGPASAVVVSPRRTLLIVDDERHVSAALHRLLHRENYAIVTAQRAWEAFEMLALHDVQVILCDQCMPGMDGVEFLDKVKEMYPDTMRIMLTGCADLASVANAVNRGQIYRFFMKPWDERALRDAIRDAFHHYRGQRGGGRLPVAAEHASADVMAEWGCAMSSAEGE